MLSLSSWIHRKAHCSRPNLDTTLNLYYTLQNSTPPNLLLLPQRNICLLSVANFSTLFAQVSFQCLSSIDMARRHLYFTFGIIYIVKKKIYKFIQNLFFLIKTFSNKKNYFYLKQKELLKKLIKLNFR